MKAKLTPREAKFVKKYFEGGSLAECAKYAGYHCKNYHSFQQMGYDVLKRLDITMEETLERAGLTDEAITRTLQEGRSAEKKYFGTWQGEIVESKPFPDVPTRLKAVELVGRMKGHFVDRTEITGKDGGDLILQISSSKRDKHRRAVTLKDD